MNAAAAKALADSKSSTKSSGERLYGGLCGDSIRLSEHGVPPGIVFLLRLLLESAFAFGLIFVVYLPLMRDNERRNELRNTCRLVMADGDAAPIRVRIYRAADRK